MAQRFWRSDRFSWGSFAFLAPRPRPGWPGWALLLLGSVTLALATRQWLELNTEAELAQVRLDNRRALAPPERAPAPVVTLSPEMEARERERQQILRILQLDWPALFAALENAQTADIALLTIQPDARRGLLVMTGEARDMGAVIDYQRRLTAGLRDVVLTTHEVQEQNPHKPVRFTVSARWAAGEGS